MRDDQSKPAQRSVAPVNGWESNRRPRDVPSDTGEMTLAPFPKMKAGFWRKVSGVMNFKGSAKAKDEVESDE